MAGHSTPEMTAEVVLELMKLFDEHHIVVIVDGGWGVDALLGEQSRPHIDLDIAIPHQFVLELRRVLEARGYTDILPEDTTEYNFVLGDEYGHQVDIHIYAFDDQGNLLFGLPYPLDSLAGHGKIMGYPVRCVTPEWLIKFHTGYKLDENDYHDVSALCKRFGIELPEEYEGFAKNNK